MTHWFDEYAFYPTSGWVAGLKSAARITQAAKGLLLFNRNSLSKERFELYRSLHVESRKSADMKAIAKARKALNKTRKR